MVVERAAKHLSIVSAINLRQNHVVHLVVAASAACDNSLHLAGTPRCETPRQVLLLLRQSTLHGKDWGAAPHAHDMQPTTCKRTPGAALAAAAPIVCGSAAAGR